MFVGFALWGADSKSYMFPDDSCLRKCSGCGYRLDFFAHNPRYRLRQSKFDLAATYDGQLIGSADFKQFCEREGYLGLRFLEFDTDELHFHVIVDNVVPFDASRRGVQFEKFCPVCGNYESVIGGSPAFLRVNKPLPNQFFRSDLLFASGNEKSPVLCVGFDVRHRLERAGIRGIIFQQAEGLE